MRSILAKISCTLGQCTIINSEVGCQFSSVVEQLIRNEQVVGSSPTTGSTLRFNYPLEVKLSQAFHVSTPRLKQKAAPHRTGRRLFPDELTLHSGFERTATATTLAGIRIDDLETTTGQFIFKINLTATQIIRTEFIYHNTDATTL